MASKTTAIVLPETREIQNLPKFGEALAKLAKLDTELGDIERQGRELKIIDRASFDRADVLNQRRKEIVKEADEIVKPYKAPLRKWLDFVQQHFNVVKNHSEQASTFFDTKMAAFTREDELRRQAEQQRLQREVEERNAKAAEEKRKADLAEAAEKKKNAVAEIKRQYKAGDITKAQYVKAMKEADAAAETATEQAELEAETRKAAPPAVKVESGVRQGRTYYHAKCVDRKTFVAEFIKRIKAGDESMLRFITADDSELDKAASEVKDSTKLSMMYPGVKAWEDKSF